MDKPMHHENSYVEKIAKGLSEAQRSRMVTADPNAIDRFHYHHFKGQSQGLFVVAAGWKRMEMSPLGCEVRDYLLRNPDA